MHLSLLDSDPLCVYFVICHNRLPFCAPLNWYSVCVIFLCHCCPVCYLALPMRVFHFLFHLSLLFFSWCNCATSVAIPFVSNMCASMQGTVEALSGWSSLSCSALFAGHNIYSLPDSRSYTHSLPLYLHIWMLCFPCRCLVLVVLDAHVGAWFTFTTPTLDCLRGF